MPTPITASAPGFIKIDGMMRAVKPSTIVAVTLHQNIYPKVHLTDGTMHSVSRHFDFAGLAAAVANAIGTPLLRMRAHSVTGTTVYLHLVTIESYAVVPGGLALHCGGPGPMILHGFDVADMERALSDAGVRTALVSTTPAAA